MSPVLARLSRTRLAVVGRGARRLGRGVRDFYGVLTIARCEQAARCIRREVHVHAHAVTFPAVQRTHLRVSFSAATSSSRRWPNMASVRLPVNIPVGESCARKHAQERFLVVGFAAQGLAAGVHGAGHVFGAAHAALDFEGIHARLRQSAQVPQIGKILQRKRVFAAVFAKIQAAGLRAQAAVAAALAQRAGKIAHARGAHAQRAMHKHFQFQARPAAGWPRFRAGRARARAPRAQSPRLPPVSRPRRLWIAICVEACNTREGHLARARRATAQSCTMTASAPRGADFF